MSQDIRSRSLEVSKVHQIGDFSCLTPVDVLKFL